MIILQKAGIDAMTTSIPLGYHSGKYSLSGGRRTVWKKEIIACHQNQIPADIQTTMTEDGCPILKEFTALSFNTEFSLS